ncbi:uncharacterized protein SCHCODRAFT_02471405, partial [Schizophyllum commune H4-8]|uniref:uncharacterized protein n=1 Tax=Schizophyllum commune (strain H4-8 / FGSC 9210) TaxID=578458 RepID=UPI00215E132E
HLTMLLRCHCSVALGRQRPFIVYNSESWAFATDPMSFQQVMSPKSTPAACYAPTTYSATLPLVHCHSSTRPSDHTSDSGESFDCNGERFLHTAARTGHLSIASRRLERGASCAAHSKRT